MAILSLVSVSCTSSHRLAVAVTMLGAESWSSRLLARSRSAILRGSVGLSTQMTDSVSGARRRLTSLGDPGPMDARSPESGPTYRIGEIASLSHLSIRTLRYWEEVGLLAPAERTDGGFRLYSQADLDRIMLIRAMKPIDFSIDELKDIVGLVDKIRAHRTDDADRIAGKNALEEFVVRIRSRCEIVRNRLTVAEAAAVELELLIEGD